MLYIIMSIYYILFIYSFIFTNSRPLSALVLIRWLSECMSRRWQAKGWGDVDWVADGIGVSKKRWGMSLNFPVVAYTPYSRAVTTFLFIKG